MKACLHATMSGRSDDNPGEGNQGDRNEDSFYSINETVEITGDSGGRRCHVWDIEEDVGERSKFVIRAIARNSNENIQCYILPKEEVESFKNGQNVWWEYRSSSDTKVTDEVEISSDDERPFRHSGDYVLVVEVTRRKTTPHKVSVKFRKADNE